MTMTVAAVAHPAVQPVKPGGVVMQRHAGGNLGKTWRQAQCLGGRQLAGAQHRGAVKQAVLRRTGHPPLHLLRWHGVGHQVPRKAAKTGPVGGAGQLSREGVDGVGHVMNADSTLLRACSRLIRSR